MISEEDLLFGKIAIDMNLLSPTQLEKVKQDLSVRPGKKIGELLVECGYLYPWDIQEILNEQKKRQHIQQLESTPAIKSMESESPKPDHDHSQEESVLKPVLPSSESIPAKSNEPQKPLPKPATGPGLLGSVKSSTLETSQKGKGLSAPSQKTVLPSALTASAKPSAGPVGTSSSQDGQKNDQKTSVTAESSERSSVSIEELVEFGALGQSVPVADKLKNLLQVARKAGASDLHLCVGSRPFVRIHKTLRFMNEEVLSSEKTEQLIFESISEAQKRILLQRKSLDLCIALGSERYRSCFYKQINGWEASFRIVSEQIPAFEKLGLPPSVKKLTEYGQGLILVTGPTGSGKTTTLAAMIDLINSLRTDHIITVEDPVEYIHTPKQCQITQRELGVHTKSFANALKGALRQDPDIIMIGEMRDRETMSMAISASETGHLVLGTMPTSSAARTINAVVDFFPPEQQNQIRSMIAESLRGIICQQLLPSKDQKGVVLALETLIFDAGVSAIVRQNQMHQLPSVMQTGKGKGMQSMDDALLGLVKSGQVDVRSALPLAQNKTLFSGLVS